MCRSFVLYSSHSYTVKSTYNYLTAVDIVPNEGFNHLLWLKAVSLKVNIFFWRLFLNRLATNEICVGDVFLTFPKFLSQLCVVG